MILILTKWDTRGTEWKLVNTIAILFYSGDTRTPLPIALTTKLVATPQFGIMNKMNKMWLFLFSCCLIGFFLSNKKFSSLPCQPFGSFNNRPPFQFSSCRSELGQLTMLTGHNWKKMATILIKTVKTRSWIVQIWNAYEGNNPNRGEGMVTNGNNEIWEIAFLLANQQQKSEKMDFMKDLRKVLCFFFHLHLFTIITNQGKIRK